MEPARTAKTLEGLTKGPFERLDEKASCLRRMDVDQTREGTSGVFSFRLPLLTPSTTEHARCNVWRLTFTLGLYLAYRISFRERTCRCGRNVRNFTTLGCSFEGLRGCSRISR